jgi:hypothetical protein
MLKHPKITAMKSLILEPGVTIINEPQQVCQNLYSKSEVVETFLRTFFMHRTSWHLCL